MTPEQIKQAIAVSDMSIRSFAAECGLSRKVIDKMVRGLPVYTNQATKVRTALEARGVRFLDAGAVTTAPTVERIAPPDNAE